MPTIKTYCKGAPFYNAFIRPYPVFHDEERGQSDAHRAQRTVTASTFALWVCIVFLIMMSHG